MIITCPACSTKYALPANSVAGAGRDVRCARCGHQWFLENPELADMASPSAEQNPAEEAAAAPDEVTAELDEPTTDADVMADADQASGVDDADDDAATDGLADDAADIDMGEEAEDPWEKRRRRAAAGDLPPAINRAPTMPDAATTSGGGRKAAGWLVFALLVGGSVAGAHYGKMQVVEALPQAQQFYEMAGYSFAGPLDGLDLPEVRSTRSLENGTSVLVVQGTVANTSQENKRIPMLRAELLDEAGSVISDWTFSPDISVVAANSEAPFEEVVIDPDPRAENVVVSFVGAETTGQ